MNEYPIANIPAKPLTHFEHQMESNKPDPWLTDPQIPNSASLTFCVWAPNSSSWGFGAVKALSLRQLGSPTCTASWIGVPEYFIDRLHAEERAISVNIDDVSENLFELRRLTGFTWTHLANLLNVDRRTLNNWAKGAKLREQNCLHIAKTLKVLRYADRGSAELNSSALNEPHAWNEPNPFEAIRTGDYETAKQWLSHGLSRPDSWQAATDSTPLLGEFQSMVMHAGADGTELIDPLPDEPEPVSRKRQIRHG